MITKKLRECFTLAEQEEQKGRKHKGLLITKKNKEEAKEYLLKAKKNLELCNFYKEQGFDYKLPEEWFYTLYYCALAILTLFGVESRNQRFTALLLRYLKDKQLIDYDDDLINRIQVHQEKENISDVDAREKGRYSSLIQLTDVHQQYENMMTTCKKAITQCEETIFANKQYELPKEILP